MSNRAYDEIMVDFEACRAVNRITDLWWLLFEAFENGIRGLCL